jgi:hypothetical protein
MRIDPQEFAGLLGTEIVGEVRAVGGGAFGMARLACILHQCLSPSQTERLRHTTNFHQLGPVDPREAFGGTDSPTRATEPFPDR